MEQPQHAIRATHTSLFTPLRLTVLGIAVGVNIAFAVALNAGLVATLVEKLPDILKAEVIPEKLPDKTPPPPPPDLKEPPPPFVPPPDFVIQTEAAPTNAITTQSKVATPQRQISSPASIGRVHTCGSEYPALSVRLGEQGTTLLSFHIAVDGSVKDLAVANSSGSQRLDDAAVNCAARWRYKPAIENNQPVEVPWKTKVVWDLKNR